MKSELGGFNIFPWVYANHQHLTIQTYVKNNDTQEIGASSVNQVGYASAGIGNRGWQLSESILYSTRDIQV